MSSMTTRVQQGELETIQTLHSAARTFFSQALMFLEDWTAWPRGAWIHFTPEKKIYSCAKKISGYVGASVCNVKCVRLPPCFIPCSSIYPPSKPSLPHSPGLCFNLDISNFPCHRQSVKLPDLRPEESKVSHCGKLFPQPHCFCTPPGCRWTQSLLPFCTRLEE